MGKFAKWAGWFVLALIVLAASGLGAVYALSQHRMNRVYQVQVRVPRVPDDAEAVARGSHIADIRGCKGCHGPDLGGGVIIDDAMVARLVAVNLTSAGRARMRTDADWVRAIRHGIAPDGRSLLFMPAQEFHGLSDQDLGDLLAYLHHLQPVQRSLPASRVGPLGRVLFLAGKVPLLPAEVVDHDDAAPSTTPIAAATPEYGAYLAAGCKGCHGEGLSGGHIPGTPPDWPDARNLTPDKTGLAGWSEDDFRKVLREGIAPGGRRIKVKYMPVRDTRHMTDLEISALYAYVRTLPPKPWGQR